MFGLEGDFGWTNAHGTGTAPHTSGVVDPGAKYDVNWNAHRSRADYAFDNWLLFIAGGLAVADFEFHEGQLTTTIPGRRERKIWVVDRWRESRLHTLVGRVEYLYDHGHKDYTGVTGVRIAFRY